MSEIDFGAYDYLEPKKDDHFPNQGKAITNKERLEIVTKFNFNKGTKTTHKMN
jgi:hypothetical protein